MEHQLLKFHSRIFLSIWATFFVITGYATAQTESFDTKGKEFYVNFMPNLHQLNLDDQDSIYLFMTAEKPTKVYLSFNNINGSTQREEISILDVSKIYTISKPYWNYELIGDFNNLDDVRSASETVQNQSVVITSDEEINVYGLSASVKSSDAFLVYPKDVLGKQYFVMSYTSDIVPSSFTPSQFSITATEDNTTITINPKCRTSRNKTTPFSITLNKGKSYLVQADAIGTWQDNKYKSDLTGTEIVSNKPIAVFGGHQRSTLPREAIKIHRNPSRDVLVDQIPPVQAWGKNAFVIPFPQPVGISNQYSDKFRIISSENSNKVKIGDIEITLNSGDYYEGDIANTAISIEAEKPILVAQYKRTASFTDSETKVNSDPLMIVIPPKEQFIKAAKLMNMQKQDENREEVFPDQYILIVSPNSATSQCKLDNRTINASEFIPIPNSAYSYSIQSTIGGAHDFESDAKCGLYVVGYGNANSYGYVGGMEVKIINDTLPPQIFTDKECFRLVGTIRDDLSDSEGLQEVKVVEELLNNVQVNLPTNYIGSAVAKFTVDLIDPNKDGIYAIKVIDNKNNELLLIDTIQGRTLIASYTDGIENNFGLIPIAHQVCRSIKFSNTGILPYSIDRAILNSGIDYSIPQSQFPTIILPSESKDIMVCFSSANSIKPILTDSLRVILDCYSLTIPLKSEVEALTNTKDSKCGQPIKLTLTKTVSELILEEITMDEENGSGKIIFALPKQTHAKLVVFDAIGSIKQVLLDEQMPQGIFELNINTIDYESGVYFINLYDEDKILTRKLLINR